MAMAPTPTPMATLVMIALPSVPVLGAVASATPLPETKIYLPVVPNNGQSSARAQAQTIASPTPTSGPIEPTPTPSPMPTRGPIRVTKLGLGVYTSGGAMLSELSASRPSVILLLDPTVDFAQSVRKLLPDAFIVGRIYAKDQPLDNPTQRGIAFADRVAQTAVPLKGVVNAWMSYNEVADATNPTNLRDWNDFQVAFAHQLQDHYGIDAVAGNDGPMSVPAEDYPRYFAGALTASHYFGIHAYPAQGINSLRDPAAQNAVFFYRKIHAALNAAGIHTGPYIITELGLYAGWRGVVPDSSMAADFTWVADQLNQDPYVLGACIFGLFGSGWGKFNIASSSIPATVGAYNTVR